MCDKILALSTAKIKNVFTGPDIRKISKIVILRKKWDLRKMKPVKPLKRRTNKAKFLINKKNPNF